MKNIEIIKIRERDKKYLNRIGFYKAIRDIFNIISIILLSEIVISIFSGYPSEGDSGSGGIVFCALISYIAHIRIQHIESIVYYRDEIDLYYQKVTNEIIDR